MRNHVARFALLPLVLVGLASACGSPTATRPDELAGEWWAPPVNVAASHAGGPRQVRRIIRLDRGGEYRRSTYLYGEHGAPADRNTSWESEVGRWRVDGNGMLALRAHRIERWQAGDGLNAPPRVEFVREDGEFTARYTVAGDVLTLRWISYALDAPREEVDTYGRARPIG
jgi:hypothetical protein